MARLIDADDLKSKLHAAVKESIEIEDTAETMFFAGVLAATFDMAVDKSPTVEAVEVVRCKDCKHCPPDIGTKTKGMVWCRKFRCEVKPNGFCSYGEKGGTK